MFKILFYFLVLALILVLYGFLEYYWLRTTYLTFQDFKIKKEIPKEIKGTRIVFLSDFQFDHRSRNFLKTAAQNVVDKTNELNPDLVILGGDYIHQKHENNALIFDYLGKINAQKVAILGNHDYRDYDKTMVSLRDRGIPVLINERIDYKGINIIGVDDYFKGKPYLPNYDKSKINLLVSHNPDFVGSLEHSDSIDIVLSGHLHAGQISLFGIYTPAVHYSKFGTQYFHGLNTDIDFSIYTGAGVGGTVEVFPIRIFARPEIVVIDV